MHDELDDEQAERLDACEAEIETLSECTYIWSDRQKARAGAIVSVTHDGKRAVLPSPAALWGSCIFR